MDVLRERECKDSMERQLSDERKLRGKFRIFFNPHTDKKHQPNEERKKCVYAILSTL